MENTFSGSFSADEVVVYANPIRVLDATVPEVLVGKGLADKTLAWRESEIASLSDGEYMGMYEDILQEEGNLFAKDVFTLATKMAFRNEGRPIVLVSLMRAGTIIGVLLKRALGLIGCDCSHYSICGVNSQNHESFGRTMDHIRTLHDERDVVFVDGWTSAGSISTLLHSAVSRYNAERLTRVKPTLAVLVDLTGTAAFSAAVDDYLVPSAMLRAIGCGLLSASIDTCLQNEGSAESCLYFEELLPHDRSNALVDAVMGRMHRLVSFEEWRFDTDEAKLGRFEVYSALRQKCRDVFGNCVNVKPGMSESTRILSAGQPARVLLVRGSRCKSLQSLIYLAKRQQVEVQFVDDLPYMAATVVPSKG